jgi:hypothetical protein
MLSVYQKYYDNCFLDRKGVMVVEFMDQGTMLQALQNTQKSVHGHSEQKAWNADIQCSAPP